MPGGAFYRNGLKVAVSKQVEPMCKRQILLPPSSLKDTLHLGDDFWRSLNNEHIGSRGSNSYERRAYGQGKLAEAGKLGQGPEHSVECDCPEMDWAAFRFVIEEVPGVAGPRALRPNGRGQDLDLGTELILILVVDTRIIGPVS
jgi:hypothetical protein